MPSDDALEAMAAHPSPTGTSVAPATSEAPSRSSFGWLTRIREIKELNILLALIVLCAFLSFASPYFLSTNNLLGVARAFTLTAIAAIGQTMVIITGGIDLSVGSIIGLSGLSTGMLLASGVPLVPAVIAGLAV